MSTSTSLRSSSSRRRQRRTPRLNDAANDAIDLTHAAPATLMGAGRGKQTWSRYLVTKYLSHFRWYNPSNLRSRPEAQAPSLEMGWAYFEHFTLPRRYEDSVGGVSRRAPPGEADGTKLYSVFATSQQALSDWGIGMSMYFASLRATGIIFALAGALSVYNALYYASDQYDTGPGLKDFSLTAVLQFTAVCTDREWVVCSQPQGAEKCGETPYWNNMFTQQYIGTATGAGANGEDVTLIERTKCDMARTLLPGLVNYGTLMFLIVCMALYNWYLSRREVRFDEDNTTPSDYTLVVRNPPHDAHDPDEWRDFFEVFSDRSVTLVTVALDNQSLVEALVRRRRDVENLRRSLLASGEVDFDDVRAVEKAVEMAERYREGEEARRWCLSKLLCCALSPLLRCLGLVSPDEAVLWERAKAAAEEIGELQKKDHSVAAVYVTFETEQGQRNALEALNASEFEKMANVAMNVDETALFRGKVLRAEEAGEPNTVRWTDLAYGNMSRAIRQAITMFLTVGLVVLAAFVLFKTRTTVDTWWFAIILSAFNAIIPIVLRILISYEKHHTESSVQKSFYLNITVFRWVNTAVVTRIITPMLATIGEEKIDLINTISMMMISEMIVSPLLRYFDFFTILHRHVLAPRAKTEEQLFGYFRGGWYNLAERFTDFTKVLLLCTFYSAFHPLVYFFGAGILFFQYWMDKFLLLRSWQQAPYFGAETSRFSRLYFNSLALVLGVISSAYAYSQSPFTMLCSCDVNNKECALPDSLEFMNVKLGSDETIPVVQASDEGFYFCNQSNNEFPPLPTEQGDDIWMTDSQKQLSQIYGYTSLVMVILYCVFMFGERASKAVMSLIKGVYKPRGTNQNKDFSSGIGLESFGYIPQLMGVPGFQFPLLICNIDDVDVELIGWKDPNCKDERHPYDDHNLIFDVPHDSLHRSRNQVVDKNMPRGENGGRKIFSVVKHYPPKWALDARENQQR